MPTDGTGPADDACLPARLGEYAIERELGSGAFGVVYLAEDVRNEHRVALKVLRRDSLSKSIQARFRAEIEALRILADEGHLHFPRVHETGYFDGVPFAAMDYVAGGPIDEYCDSRELTVRERLQLFVGVCRAVLKAHRAGIVHRDLKPQHILVHDDDGHLALGPRVIDFGIARGLDFALDLQVNTAGALVGTPGFLSPEQARGERVNVQTDVYSLGVVLYLLLTGCMPREAEPDNGESIVDSANKQLPAIDRRFAEVAESHPERADELARRRSTTVDSLQRELRGDLRLIVQWATYVERGLRYADVAALVDEIENYLGYRPVKARQGSGLYEFALWVKRRRGVVATATSLLLSLSLAVLFFWQQAKTARAEGMELAATLEQERGVSLAAGRRLAERGKWRDALTLFEKAEATGIGDRHAIGIEKARALEANYQVDAARQLIEQLLPTAQPSHRARLLLLRGDLGKQRFKEPTAGLDDVREALDIDRELQADGQRPALSTTERLYAKALLAETPRQSLQLLRSARVADASDHRVNQCYAMSLILLGEREAAIRFAGTFQAQNPDDEEAHYTSLMMHALGNDDDVVQASIDTIQTKFGNDAGELADAYVKTVRLIPWANETLQRHFLSRDLSIWQQTRTMATVLLGITPLLRKLEDRREARRLRGLEDVLMRVPPSLAEPFRQLVGLEDIKSLRPKLLRGVLTQFERRQADGALLLLDGLARMMDQDGPAALRRLDDALASPSLLIYRRVQLDFATLAGVLVIDDKDFGVPEQDLPAAKQQVLGWLDELMAMSLTPAELWAACYTARELRSMPRLIELLLRSYRAEPDKVRGKFAYVEALYRQKAEDEARRIYRELAEDPEAIRAAGIPREEFDSLGRLIGK